MASQKPMDERVRALVAAVLTERPEKDEHIDDIERDMEALADAVANEFAAQLLARQAQAPANCPIAVARGNLSASGSAPSRLRGVRPR